MENNGREAHRPPVGRRIGDPTDELEELRRADDGVRDRPCLHGFLLSHLRAEVAAVRETVGPDDGQRDMVAHAGAGFRREDVARRGLEELHHRRVVPHGRVRHVDDNLGSRERVGEPFARDRVDTRIRRRRERFVTRLVEDLDELRPDEAGSTDDNDLHVVPLSPMGSPVDASADRALLLWAEDRGCGCALESADAPAWTPVTPLRRSVLRARTAVAAAVSSPRAKTSPPYRTLLSPMPLGLATMSAAAR